MFALRSELLRSSGDERIGSPEFQAVYNAHGLYSTLQFVLRLSPVVHDTLSKFNPGILTNGEVGFDGAQAMSTYLHETIHWWQHIGSTYGFVFSLNYPVQTHVTHHDLKRLVAADGFKKSVAERAVQLGQTRKPAFDNATGIANTIVNNHFDLLTFRTFTLGPDDARKISSSKYFESMGHAFHMTYAHTVNTLATTVDPEFKTFFHPKEWEAGFAKLRDDKVDGYYYGSPIGLHKIGSREIFEGQARFSQIQFLSYACAHRLTLDDYRNLGMLDGVYVAAFDWFLHLIEAERPTTANDPLVGLFLLICDQAIKPEFAMTTIQSYRS